MVMLHRGGQYNGGRNGHVTEASQFNGGENGHVTEVDPCIFYCILWSIGIALFLVYSISYL